MDDRLLLGSIFPIRSSMDSGTCFLFGDRRHVLTAKHVVATAARKLAGELSIEVEPGKLEPIAGHQLLGFCDIALLELTRELPPAPLEPITSGRELRPGQRFRAAGFAANISERWHPGEFVGRRKLGEYELRFDHSLNLQLSGLSGAPVFDTANKVAGVIIEHDPLTPSAGKMVPFEDFRYYLDFAPAAACFSCVVIFSDAEPERNGVLRTAIEEALGILEREWRQPIEFRFDYATEIISARESYLDAVRRLCRAEVCIFDLTNYQPAVMLLLGIRSVVKRGITIGSTADGIEKAPYDIRELSLISHAKPVSMDLKLRNVIAERIRTGRNAQLQQHYLDLPTYEAVRNLPPGHRGEILPSEHVLLLSSYSPRAEPNLSYVQDRLQFQLETRQVQKPWIARVLDLNLRSPWLVSQNMYEAIRRTKLCIVDWTNSPRWPENVFFELGVRIAVRKGVTFCILEEPGDRAEGAAADSARSEQEKNLIALFRPFRYRLTDVRGEVFATIMNLYDQWQGANAEPLEGPCEYTYRQISMAIDPRQGLLARTTPVDLLLSAQLLGADDTEGLSAVLYPENLELSNAAQLAARERLWAAWHYMTGRYSLGDLANDPDLREAIKAVGRNLMSIVGAGSAEVQHVKETLRQLLQARK
jgi:hypothetical protein